MSAFLLGSGIFFQSIAVIHTWAISSSRLKNESKSSEPQDSDRLSELHDSLIFNIFEFLPMNDLVRTQILSQPWKNLWTLTPFLYFQNVNDCDNTEFRNFVNRALSSWRGSRVQKFKVSGIVHEHVNIFDDDWEPAIFTDIDSWLRFGVDNGVEELDISFKGSCFADDKFYYVPQFLYSCSSLKKLSFSGCIIEITGKTVQWNELSSLTIQGFEVTALVVKQILHGSPRLEVFNLYFEESDGSLNLNIRSSSLKVLLISKVLGGRDDIADIPRDTELRIWAPNLKSLRIEGMPYGKCLLKNVSSLTHVSLWFYELHGYAEFDEATYGFNFSPHNYLEETLNQILPAIRHVEGLALSDWSIKVLLNMNSKSVLSTFSNVKFLSLNGKFEEVKRMLGLLEFFPELETLVVNENRQYNVARNLKFKWNPSMYFLDKLRTVEVTWNQRDFLIFPLIQSLLKYARQLEKMVFRVKENPPLTSAPPISLFLASKELCRMPRSSPTVELIICEN